MFMLSATRTYHYYKFISRRFLLFVLLQVPVSYMYIYTDEPKRGGGGLIANAGLMSRYVRIVSSKSHHDIIRTQNNIYY